MLQRTDPELLRQLDAGVDLSKPSVKGLAYLLRNKQLWPAGFIWEYQYHCGCAMGLAKRMWGKTPEMPDRQFKDAFYGRSDYGGKPYKRLGFIPKPMSKVTPEDVAARLESYL